MVNLKSYDLAALRHRLLSGGAWALTGKIATVLAGLLVNALLARLLSPQNLGAYFLAVSVITLGAVIGALGLNQVVVRLVAESVGLGQFGHARRLTSMILKLGILGSLCVAVAYMAFGRVIGEQIFGSPALATVTILISGWMLTIALQSLLAETFRGLNDVRLASVFGGSSSSMLLAAGLTLLWLLVESTTLTIVILIALSANLVSVAVSAWLLRRKTATLSVDNERVEVEYGALFKVAWPLLVTNLTFFVLTQSDLWILGVFRPQEDVAIYGAAARLVLLLSMPLLIVNLVVPPLIAALYAQGRRMELEHALRVTATLAGIPALLVLASFVLFGETLLKFVYGQYYLAGSPVLTLLSLGQLVSVLVGSCGITLMMTGHQLIMMVITIVCGVLTVGLGLWVVGPYGPVGMAAVAAFGLMLQNVLMWLSTRIVTGMWTHVSLLKLFEGKKPIGMGQ